MIVLTLYIGRCDLFSFKHYTIIGGLSYLIVYGRTIMIFSLFNDVLNYNITDRDKKKISMSTNTL